MRKVMRWRYYCDHCGKSGANGGHIRRHEAHCCANPDRACRMCRHATGEENAQRPLAELVEAFRVGDVQGLRAAAGGCPACMLAAVIAWKRDEVEDGNPAAWVEFDYQAEVNRMWASVNDAAEADDYVRREYAATVLEPERRRLDVARGSTALDFDWDNLPF